MKKCNNIEFIYLVSLFLLYLLWTTPALFWGTQTIDELKRYNLHPDEKTHLGAIGKKNFPPSHWDGAGYYNFVQLAYFVAEKSFILTSLDKLFRLQQNGPILLVGRFLNILLVFASALLIFRLVYVATDNKGFSALGMLLYLTLPAVQVSGHYMRPHILLNFLLLIVLHLLTRYFQSEDRRVRIRCIQWMFLLSGILFSVRYPFGFVIIFPIYLTWKSHETKQIIPYSLLAVAGAFTVNPYFFIHLRTSLRIASNSPFSGKLKALLHSSTMTDFFTILSPANELEQILLKVIPNSMGGLHVSIVLGLCLVGYLFLDRKNRAVNYMLLFLLYYLSTWILLGQTVTDGLSRFALPFLLLFVLLIPMCFARLCKRYPSARLSFIVVGLLLVVNGFLFSSELLYKMSEPDPRWSILRETKHGKIYFLNQLGWDYGLFSEMKGKVTILQEKDLVRHSGETLWYVDISVYPRNPYEHKRGLKLVEVISQENLIGLWDDRSYLHDYKYFTPTIFKYCIQGDSNRENPCLKRSAITSSKD